MPGEGLWIVNGCPWLWCWPLDVRRLAMRSGVFAWSVGAGDIAVQRSVLVRLTILGLEA